MRSDIRWFKEWPAAVSQLSNADRGKQTQAPPTQWRSRWSRPPKRTAWASWSAICWEHLSPWRPLSLSANSAISSISMVPSCLAMTGHQAPFLMVVRSGAPISCGVYPALEQATPSEQGSLRVRCSRDFISQRHLDPRAGRVSILLQDHVSSDPANPRHSTVIPASLAFGPTSGPSKSSIIRIVRPERCAQPASTRVDAVANPKLVKGAATRPCAGRGTSPLVAALLD